MASQRTAYIVATISSLIPLVQGQIQCGSVTCFGSGAYCCSGVGDLDNCCYGLWTFWWFWCSWLLLIVLLSCCGCCCRRCCTSRQYTRTHPTLGPTYGREPSYMVATSAPPPAQNQYLAPSAPAYGTMHGPPPYSAAAAMAPSAPPARPPAYVEKTPDYTAPTHQQQ